MMNIKDKDKRYIAGTYARFPVAIISGKGSLLQDEEGKEYIDLGTGIAVNTFGAADEEWICAVTAQLSKVQHTSNLYYSEPDTVLAEMLCQKTGMKKVFFSNSGAEANECAIKAARKYASEKKGKEYSTIITMKNSFHGRTITTLAATGQEVFHQDFTPLTPGFVSVEPNDTDALEAAVKANKTAAVMFECVQGEGGVVPLEKTYVQKIAELAEKYDFLTIVDEVQTGNGRSGTLYSYMQFGLTPDIVTTAKGLGGGLPIGATLLGDKVKDVFHFGIVRDLVHGNAGDHESQYYAQRCDRGTDLSAVVHFQIASFGKDCKQDGQTPEKDGEDACQNSKCRDNGQDQSQNRHTVCYRTCRHILIKLLRRHALAALLLILFHTPILAHFSYR